MNNTEPYESLVTMYENYALRDILAGLRHVLYEQAPIVESQANLEVFSLLTQAQALLEE